MRKKEGNLLFEFLQVAIGIRKSLSIAIDEGDWLRLFEFCKKQALIGVGFSAIEKLHALGVECPSNLRMKWMALALQIEKRNSVLNEQCSQLARRYEHDVLSTCTLKGQGNCLNYRLYRFCPWIDHTKTVEPQYKNREVWVIISDNYEKNISYSNLAKNKRRNHQCY